MESVFAVPVADKWLLHAPLHGITALLNKSAAAALKEGVSICKTPDLLELFHLLDHTPQDIPGPHQGNLKPRFLGLITTRKCNLNCLYCNFGAVQNCDGTTMDLDLAAAAVDWMLELTLDAKKPTLEVHFFGGEPFCAPQVIEAAVHRARYQAGRFGLKTHFEVSTNACFDEKYCTFAADYLDSIVVSLDGTPDIQNRQRPLAGGGGSYDLAARNILALSRSGAELCLRVCVSQDSVGRMDTIAAWLAKNFHPSSISFESMQASPLHDSGGLQAPDPWYFAAAYLNASYLLRSAGITPVYAAADSSGPRHCFCPLGRDTLIVTPEGRVNGCYLLEDDWVQRGLDLNYGYINKPGEPVINDKSIDRVRALTGGHPLRCGHCIARFCCAGGCRVSHSYPGCPEVYDDFCIQTRIITVGQLLNDIGCRSQAEMLCACRKDLEKLVFYPSDLLTDWSGIDV
ncbi:MAG: radical SAM protein [Deltaproteobacteria bacterium]